MKVWKIPVSYIVAGTVSVEANTLEEAINIVWDNDTSRVIDEEIVGGSWQVDDADNIHLLRDWYNDGQEDET